MTDFTTQPGLVPGAMDRAMVRRMLMTNPEWVREDAELLSHIAAAPVAGGAIDLGFVVREKLLDEVRTLKQRQRAIAEHARNNLALLARAQAFVLSLMESTDPDTLDYKLAWEAPAALGVEKVRLFLEGATPMIVSEAIHACGHGLTDELLGDENDFTGACAPRTSRTLYGTDMGSHALCRIHAGGLSGFLALAAAAPDQFHTGQGTEILNFVTRAVERLMDRWLSET